MNHPAVPPGPERWHCKRVLRVEETAQQLGPQTALAEHPSSVPSTHVPGFPLVIVDFILFSVSLLGINIQATSL